MWSSQCECNLIANIHHFSCLCNMNLMANHLITCCVDLKPQIIFFWFSRIFHSSLLCIWIKKNFKSLMTTKILLFIMIVLVFCWVQDITGLSIKFSRNFVLFSFVTKLFLQTRFTTEHLKINSSSVTSSKYPDLFIFSFLFFPKFFVNFQYYKRTKITVTT